MSGKQYQWLGIVSLLKKVLGKEAITFLFLIGVFVFASPADALAATQIYPLIGTDGVIVNTSLPSSGCYYPGAFGPGYNLRYGDDLHSSVTDDLGMPAGTEDDCQVFMGDPSRDDMEYFADFGDGTYFLLLGFDDTGDPLDTYEYVAVFTRTGGSWAVSLESAEDLSTRIVNVFPQDLEVVATSTNFTLEALINISVADYFETDDWFLRFMYIRQDELQAAVANPNVLWTTIDVPITSWPNFDFVFATTSIIETGEYLFKVEIRNENVINSILSWWGLQNLYDPGLVASSNTTFIVVERSILDQYIFDMASTTTALLSDPGLFEDIQDNCNPISGFDALACIISLFIPNNTQINTSMETAKTYILTKAPVGYATRVIEIMTAGATTSLPTISYTFGVGTALEGEEMNFDFNETLASANTILTEDIVSNTATGMNIWEIFTSIWNIIVYGGLLLLIVSEVMSLRIRHK